MVTVWSIRNRASPQELRSQELGRRKAGLEGGRESLHGPSIWGHTSDRSLSSTALLVSKQPPPDRLSLDPGRSWEAHLPLITATNNGQISRRKSSGFLPLHLPLPKAPLELSAFSLGGKGQPPLT